MQKLDTVCLGVLKNLKGRVTALACSSKLPNFTYISSSLLI